MTTKLISKVKPINKKDAMVEKLAFDIAEAREDVKKGRLYTADQIRQDLKIKHRKEIYL